MQTAQVASQQGAYLGKKLSKVQQSGHHLLDENDVHDDIDDMLYDPFTYFHLGSLAYIGNSAVFDLSGYSFAGGLIAMWVPHEIRRCMENKMTQISTGTPGDRYTGASKSASAQGCS